MRIIGGTHKGRRINPPNNINISDQILSEKEDHHNNDTIGLVQNLLG